MGDSDPLANCSSAQLLALFQKINDDVCFENAVTAFQTLYQYCHRTSCLCVWIPPLCIKNRIPWTFTAIKVDRGVITMKQTRSESVAESVLNVMVATENSKFALSPTFASRNNSFGAIPTMKCAFQSCARAIVF